MIFETLKDKYGLSESEVKILCDSMMQNLGLSATTAAVNGSLEKSDVEPISVHQVYALVSGLCKDMFEEHINEIAPQIAKDKVLLNSFVSDHWQADKLRNQEIKRLRSLAEDIALYEKEQKKRKDTN